MRKSYPRPSTKRGGTHLYSPGVTDGRAGVHTFLIADIRGYSRFTENYGDEAAAELSRAFADVVRDIVETHEGELREMRGDEALAVFASARQAIRAAVDLQDHLDDQTSSIDIPCKVGIGIDSGEAVQLEDGSFRGAALNIASRLCGRAHGGEVLVSEATVRLAGRLGGLHYSDRGRLRLKNIPDPIHVYKVYSELETRPATRSVQMFFAKPGRTLTWGAIALVVLVAAITAASVVYLTAGDSTDGAQARSPRVPVAQAGTGEAEARGLASVVPAALWKDCKLQTVPEQNAEETAVCLPTGGLPDRWEISSYPNGVALERAYERELGLHKDVRPNEGRCTARFWGGEREWVHGPGKPGGRFFCYFDGNDAVIVWTHGRLTQPSHRDILATAREGGTDHANLTYWWSPWHHRIGKAN
jgi:class 3 adenylate cyclase